MFREVIVGVDGRAGGRDAIALARLLVSVDGHVTLVHVHPREARRGHAPEPAAQGGRRAESERLLESQRERTGVDAELVSIAAPTVGEGLHELAVARGADLLAVGSCARGFAGRVLVGNDTRDAIHGSPCAVSVAPLDYARDLRSIATIGIGYDGSAESEAALVIARAVAAGRNAGLRALQVVQLPAAPYAGFATVVWTEALDGMVTEAERRLAELGGGVKGTAVLGLADDELAAFSRRVDLLVVGCRVPRRRHLSGSTLAHLAAHAGCPVLIVPRPAPAAATVRTSEQPAPTVLRTPRSATQ